MKPMNLHDLNRVECAEEAPHINFMNAAISLAESSCASGNHPFGAVLVVDQKIVLTAENTVVTDRDGTAHAETNLIRAAFPAIDSDARRRSTLYTSTEPCAMCAGAIYWAGIRSVVFGCSVYDLASFTSGSFVTPCREVFARGQESTDVKGPYCQERAKAVHEQFWRTNGR